MTAILAVSTLTLLSSFICSLFEAVLYTLTHTKIELMKSQNLFGAHKLGQLRSEIEEPIAAILTINTITHTAGSAWCGALVGIEFGNAYVGVFAAIFTLAILFITEIVPKSLGVKFATSIGPWIAWPLQGMIWMVWPIVQICRVLMDLLTGAKSPSAPTEDEIMIMTRLAMQGGKLRPQELRWVENALKLDRVKADDLMTPRTVVYSLPIDLPLADVTQHSEHWVHSRIPLVDERDPEHILGLVYRREIFDALAQGKKEGTLRDLMHEIDFVPETMRGHELLDKFIKERKHMVAVISEHGGFEGVVTLEDVLECLLGAEIVDETDKHTDMQQFARQKAQQRTKNTFES